jgi:hypothetical protein
MGCILTGRMHGSTSRGVIKERTRGVPHFILRDERKHQGPWNLARTVRKPVKLDCKMKKKRKNIAHIHVRVHFQNLPPLRIFYFYGCSLLYCFRYSWDFCFLSSYPFSLCCAFPFPPMLRVFHPKISGRKFAN